MRQNKMQNKHFISMLVAGCQNSSQKGGGGEREWKRERSSRTDDDEAEAYDEFGSSGCGVCESYAIRRRSQAANTEFNYA